jgi:hypothetical protein
MVADDCFGVLWLCRNDVSKDVLMCDGLDAIDFFFCLSNTAQDPTCTTEQIDRILLPKFHSNVILMPDGLRPLT